MLSIDELLDGYDQRRCGLAVSARDCNLIQNSYKIHKNVIVKLNLYVAVSLTV